MSNQEIWNEFLDNMRLQALNEYHSSHEYEYQKQREKQIDELLETNLTGDEKYMVEEVFMEFSAAAGRENEIVYLKGMKDCVEILKNLGVLA